MPFRAPKNFREWLLLFSPALVIWAASVIGFFIPSGHEGGLASEGTFVGSIVALGLCVGVGYEFTKPNPRWGIRNAWSLLATAAVVAVNFGIAFAGCSLVGAI